MLFRKMLRETRKNIAQGLSIFFLAFLALAMFCTFEGHVLAQNKARAEFHEQCSLADIWVYGEGFTYENLEAVRDLDFVEKAQLRTSFTGSAPDYDGAQTDIYLVYENLVNTPYYISGEEFDPEDEDGVWLTNAFAEKRGISVGDDFTVEYGGITVTRTVKGLIESAEYEYRQADGDADVYIENIAFVYMSFNALPDEYSDIIPYTELIIRTTDGGGLKHEEEIKDALGSDYAVMLDESSIAGIARLNSELSQHQTFSYAFVIIFAGIAVLVISTSVSRIVDRQRTQIGTMNALGMKKYKIIFHYIGASFIFSFLGATAGALVGAYVLSPAMVELFGQYYIVPGLKAGFDISYALIGAAIVIVCILSSFLSCRKVLKIRPAQALRPAPPKSGKRCIFERLPFWNRLGFIMQYNLRDISRAKLRSLMCVIGTAFGMLLMVYGVACSDLIDEMIDLNFKVQSAEWQIKLSENMDISELDAVSENLDGEFVMMSQIEVAKSKNAASDDKQTETLTVIDGKGLYNLLDVKQNIVTLSDGTVGVTRKLAADMDIKVGDTIYWHLYSKNTWHEAVVGAIYHSTETQGIAYLRSDYENTGEDFAPTWIYTDTNPEQYADESYVLSINNKRQLREAFEESMEIVGMIVWLMLVFSAVLILVVLYNSGNLSFHERVREFATLKVLGMQSGKIRRILSVQNFCLSVVGIIIGAPFGKWLFNLMMNTNGDNYDYNLTIKPLSYIISAALVLVVSVAISFLFSKRIKRLNMVDVLKDAE